MLGPKYSRPMCRLERLKWYVYPFLTGRRVWAAPRSSARPDQSQPSRRATGLGAPQTGVVHTKRLWHVCLRGTRVDETVLPNWANKHLRTRINEFQTGLPDHKVHPKWRQQEWIWSHGEIQVLSIGLASNIHVDRRGRFMSSFVILGVVNRGERQV